MGCENVNESKDFNENLTDTENENDSDANEREVDELFDQLASDAFNTTGMIDRLNDKESVENLVKDTSIQRKSTEKDCTEEKHESTEHVINDSNLEPHEPVISLSSDKKIEICIGEPIVNRDDIVNDFVDKDLLLRVENKDSKIIENLENIDSYRSSLLEEKKNVENLKNISISKDSFIDTEKENLKNN